jgi:hypothetical protein
MGVTNSGYQTRLKEELVTFRAAHQNNIDETMERFLFGYTVATMALTASISWIEGFIVFLDNYQQDLAKTKFGTKKAWHVTTRLGPCMMLEIAVPRFRTLFRLDRMTRYGNGFSGNTSRLTTSWQGTNDTLTKG